jgi:intracellular septation protein
VASPESGDGNAGVSDSNQGMKLAIELGPLLVFLLVWLWLGLRWATGAIMIASVMSMIASQRLLGRISPALVLTTVLVVGFGGLTLLLDDPRFIQMKPTIVYLLFAVTLFVGLLLRRPLLQLLLGEAIRLSEEGWRKLSLRWGCFFAVMAVLNEIVRHSFSEGTWVSFKVAGAPVLTIVFMITQMGLIQRHRDETSEQDGRSV